MRAYSNSSRLTATQTSHQEGYRYYLLYHIFLLAQVPSLKGGNFYENFTFQQGIEVHEHQFLDFADIRIGKDNCLFIDPYRVHLAALDGDVWAKKADALISSFFHTLLAAASQKIFLPSGT